MLLSEAKSGELIKIPGSDGYAKCCGDGPAVFRIGTLSERRGWLFNRAMICTGCWEVVPFDHTFVQYIELHDSAGK